MLSLSVPPSVEIRRGLQFCGFFLRFGENRLHIILGWILFGDLVLVSVRLCSSLEKDTPSSVSQKKESNRTNQYMSSDEESDEEYNFIYAMVEREFRRVITEVHIEDRVIANRAFYGWTCLRTVSFSDRLDLIGESAFRRCSSLRSINIPRYVRVINNWAFKDCVGLLTADLGEGLEMIGAGAFSRCRSLHRINIPGAVISIQRRAFSCCSGLTILILNDGLVLIEERAFARCTSLVSIEVPPTVMAINLEAFSGCMHLRTVTIRNGLKKIGRRAFSYCRSIVSIKIPPSVTDIAHDAFKECSLTTVVFCDMIEEFVSETLMRDWWNQGVHEKCLSTYCFLVQCNIPMSVDNLTQRMWLSDIHGMLQRIPSISNDNLQSYFNSINKKLNLYNTLKDVPALLELVIWKLTIITENDEDDIFDILSANTKTQYRVGSLGMVKLIVPQVLSFLTSDEYNSTTRVW